MEVKCQKCGNKRILASKNRMPESPFCRSCGVRGSMEKRSKNLEWRHSLSEQKKGKRFSEEHKKKLSVSAKARVRFKSPEGKVNYGNSWSLNRSAVLIRDGNRCRHCGRESNLQVHHMDPYKKSKNNEQSNLITLCSRCHMRAESVRLPQKTNKDVCGIILAGGRGSRLSPASTFYNKHEMPLGAVPMIFHPVGTLRSMRVTDVMVVIGRERGGRLMEMLGRRE
jgi:5-methylcytosine-specific restriction endonuclease McrA